MGTAGGAGYRLDAGAGFQSRSSVFFMLSTTMITVANNNIFSF